MCLFQDQGCSVLSGEMAPCGDKKMIEDLLPKLFRHIRTNGLNATSDVIAKNLRHSIRSTLEERFDHKFQIDTAGSIQLEDLTIDSDNKARGVYYEPTPPHVFRYILSKLDIDHREFDFVDFGCGKGRVVFLASQYPFRRVTGIEFAPELVEVAKHNIECGKSNGLNGENVDVLCMDATQFEIPDSKAVLYFYNPFDAMIMKAIAQNLETSFLKNRAEKYVIYYNPQNEVVFERLPFMKKVASEKRVVDFASPRFHGYSIFRTID